MPNIKIDKKTLEGLKRFSRFLKNNNCYDRFRYCVKHYPTPYYTIEDFFCAFKKHEDNIIQFIPFEWALNATAPNSVKFWGRIIREKWKIIHNGPKQ